MFDKQVWRPAMPCGMPCKGGSANPPLQGMGFWEGGVA